MANGNCILIADDIEFSRTVLKTLLGKDYSVIEAANGNQAVQILQKYADELSCVLLDVKMPGLDGYGVLDYMRSSGLLNKIPVIAITAVSDMNSHVQCYESGVIDLIEKPFYEDMVLYKVKFNIGRFSKFRKLEENARSRAPAEIKAYFRKTFGFETEEEVDSMYASFLESLGGCVKRLAEMEPEPDFTAVREVTHAVRGFVVAEVMPELADVNTLLNVCAKAADVDGVRAGIRRMSAVYDGYRAGEA